MDGVTLEIVPSYIREWMERVEPSTRSEVVMESVPEAVATGS